MCTPKRSKNIYKRLYRTMATKYGHLFLCVVIGVILLFIAYLCFTAFMFHKSQEDIKTCYSAHIQKTDSLFLNLMKYSSESLSRTQHINEAILADSLIKQSLGGNNGISKSQFKVLSAIITQHYDEALKIHDRNSVKLQKDSLFLSAERVLLEGQTKNMLELHLNKIEHEYSNITMWAAILTVIFLVFSFYSIFKMDELIKQGDEGVKDIKRLKKEGEKEITDFKANSMSALSNLDTKSTETFSNVTKAALDAAESLKSKIAKIEKEGEQSLSNIGNVENAFNIRSQEILQGFNASLQTMSEQHQNDIYAKIEQFNLVVVQANEILNKIKTYSDITNSKEGNNKTEGAE